MKTEVWALAGLPTGQNMVGGSFPLSSLRIKGGIQSPVLSIWQLFDQPLADWMWRRQGAWFSAGTKKDWLAPVTPHKQGGWQFGFQLCLNVLRFALLVLETPSISFPLPFPFLWVAVSWPAPLSLLPSWPFCPFCTVSIFTLLLKPLCDPCAYFCSAAWRLLFSFRSLASLRCFVYLIVKKELSRFLLPAAPELLLASVSAIYMST